MTWTPPPRTLADFDRLFDGDQGRPLAELLERVAILEGQGMDRAEAHRRVHTEAGPVSMSWSASVFREVCDREPLAIEPAWGDLVQLLGYFYRMPSGDKMRARCWSPARFSGTRAAANVEQVSALVFDFDDGTRIESVRAQLEGLPHLGHTSWSHTEEHHKFRVVIPLHKPVPGKLWRQVYRWALGTWERLKGPEIGSPDRQCSDPSRLYLVPVYREGQPRRAWNHSPPAWDWSAGLLEIPVEVLSVAPPPPARAPRPPRKVGQGELEREARKRAREDRGTRAALADGMGATLRAGIARGMACPQCKRRSAWYGLDAGKSTSARCNHANSCGWYGSVYDLALANGMRL